MELPVFKYHPEPACREFFEESATQCACCGLKRGVIYTGPVYPHEGYRNRLCPWCIADGSAHSKLAVSFVDEYGVGGCGRWDAVPRAVVEEICQRTPSFFSWQEEEWWTHCSDGAAFQGRYGAKELEAAGEEALAAIREATGIIDEGEWQEFLEALDKEGYPTAYLFRCRKCGKLGGYTDCD